MGVSSSSALSCMPRRYASFSFYFASYTPEDLVNLDTMECRYLTYNRDRGIGLHSIHGYITFKRPCTMAVARELLRTETVRVGMEQVKDDLIRSNASYERCVSSGIL